MATKKIKIIDSLVQTDTTLTQSGVAADAQAVGDAFNEVNGILDTFSSGSDGLQYTLSDDETYYICSGMGECTDTDVVVAASYNGKPVKEIGANAFDADYWDVCANVITITLPNTIETIGDCAFFSASLRRINIPSSVVNTGIDIVVSCPKIMIYCEATTQPNSWDADWNTESHPVVWNYKYQPNMVSLYHWRLKELRDNSQLIPGQFYRITDYFCTTTQENTRATDHQFDIIVQALSENTLSENASADYHYNEDGSPDGYFAQQVSGRDLLKEGTVIKYYDIYEDCDDMEDKTDDYKAQDIFVAYGYEENNEGVVVPVLYKNDVEQYPDEGADYGDIFYYVGTHELEGITYDKWRKIESYGDGLVTWDYTGRVYALTNVIVENGTIIEDVIGGANSIVKKIANLPAWELKYSLDNDTSRFAWADKDNGTGVIYWMKDEHNNECPYDFKNIQFLRDSDWQAEHTSFIEGLGVSVGDVEWFYTFSWVNEDMEVEDLTMRQGLLSCDSIRYGTHNNKMGQNITSDEIGALTLNNNLFISSYHVDFGNFYGCYSNTLGNNCHTNTFGMSCCSNSFDDGCAFNIFGEKCCENNFGSRCCENTFDEECCNNSFGVLCNSNTFESHCTGNTLGDDCIQNTFALGDDDNILGNGCSNNELASASRYNTFGSRCCNNFLADYTRYTRFADGCLWVKLISVEETGNTSNYIQNITIAAGISGTKESPLELTVSRNAPPTIFEAPGTTHIILD